MDAEQLREFLSRTPDYILRHREAALENDNGGVGGSDGADSKTPYNDWRMDLADAEAAFVGNLAIYCMRAGSIPLKSLRGYWIMNGRCLGVGAIGFDENRDINGRDLGGDYLEPIRPLIRHLRAYAGEVVSTEGVDAMLRQGIKARTNSYAAAPKERIDWVTQGQAVKITGRSDRTLKEWRKNKTVTFKEDEYGILYDRRSLDLMLKVARENKARATENATRARLEKKSA